MFETAITETVKSVEDPHRKSDGKQMTVYERYLELFPKRNGEIPFKSLGSGSDYAAFYQFVGKNSSSCNISLIMFAVNAILKAICIAMFEIKPCYLRTLEILPEIFGTCLTVYSAEIFEHIFTSKMLLIQFYVPSINGCPRRLMLLPAVKVGQIYTKS